MSEIDPTIETQQRGPNALVRTAAVLTGVAGLVGIGAVARGGEASEGFAAPIDGLEACIDGTEDVGPFEVNSGSLYVPFKEGYVIEAVCIETNTPSVERLEQGGVGDATIQIFPTIILNASVDYEVDPEAQPEGVCDPLDSGKIDVEGDFDVITITADPGEVITRYCVKAGSIKQGNGPEYVDVVPPVASLEISHSSGKDISHYSFETDNVPETTVPATTVPETTVPVTTVPVTTVPAPTTTAPATTTTTPRVTVPVPPTE